MKKLLEGLFTYRGSDSLVATTKDVSAEELETIRKIKDILPYAELRHIDRDRGYVLDGEIECDYDLVSYYYRRVQGLSAASSCHLNDVDEANFRGNPEFLHFVVGKGEIDVHSVDLFSLSTLANHTASSLERLVESNEGFDEIKDNDIYRIKTPYSKNRFFASKEDVIKLIDCIIFAKNNRKTLYICYEMHQYRDFVDLLFLALKFLPKEVCNSLSFITLYGGGLTNQFDIVGVPIEDEQIVNKSGFSNNGVVIYYPFVDTLDNEILNNDFDRIMKLISGESDLRRLDKFIFGENEIYQTLDEYLYAIKLFAPLFEQVNRYEGDERTFITRLNDRLDYVIENMDFILNKMGKDEMDLIFDGLEKSFNDIRNMSDYGKSGVELYSNIIFSLYSLADSSNSLVSGRAYEFIYKFLFDYQIDQTNETMVSFHNTLINLILNDRKFIGFTKDKLIKYLYYNKDREITNLLMENAKMSSQFNHVSCLYFETLLNYILENYESLSYPKTKVQELLALIRSIHSHKERIVILFEGRGLKLEDKVEILIDLLLKDKEGQKDDIASEAIDYIKENNLLLQVISLINLNFYQDKTNTVLKLKNDLIDVYIGVDEIIEYHQLKEVINKLNHFEKDSDDYKTVKKRIIEYHLNAFDVNSIKVLPIQQVEETEEPHFLEIKELLHKEKAPLAIEIIKAIDEKLAEKENFHKAKKLEDCLVGLRVDMLVRIVKSLPIKVSRKLIRENSYVDKFARDNGVYRDYLTASGDRYAEIVGDLVADFFTRDNNNPNKDGLWEIRRQFARDIINSQNQKKFNMHDVTFFTTNLITSLIIGGAAAIGSFLLGLLISQIMFGGGYIRFYLYLSIFTGVASGAMTLINMVNRGRRPVYLISIVETLGIMLAGVGMFILFAILLGGK